MNTFDHYAVAREIINHLQTIGHDEEAALLQNAIESGSTGTEIFMALRYRLRNILQNFALEGQAATLASQLLQELDKALK